MASEKHVRVLREGPEVWNRWRRKNRLIVPNLIEANLMRANLSRTNLIGTDLSRANLIRANLSRANLSRANLSEAYLVRADLSRANLSRANLSRASLSQANLSEAKLSRAYLSRANLSRANLINARLVQTNLHNTNLIGCSIYGISARDLKVNEGTKQAGLIITQPNEPTITVDDLEVAHFIYLLLNREKLRNVISTITFKAVLILGRFIPRRKAFLDATANELRKYNLLPIIFDFERATSRHFTETIKTLADMSLFVIADITNPKSAPLELRATMPDYQIPCVPIIEEGEEPFSMFRDLTKYSWMLKPVTYRSSADLIKTFKEVVVDEAFEMHKKLLRLKAKDMELRKLEDYLAEK